MECGVNSILRNVIGSRVGARNDSNLQLWTTNKSHSSCGFRALYYYKIFEGGAVSLI